MILNKAQNEPVLTNVATSGEFRIRNSAKAFSILSSGLYANKIRAIIRELSCNAVDSHVAAGKGNVPFVVHLPTALEPYFSVSDFGLGLNHDQVTNIYTTYFESTKTGSNDFIGALGLGSKSPFSYTDNFSITAAKDGIQNIYSAFINEVGVPSVALMSTQAGEFPNGVEVKFSVTNTQDYSRFVQEARDVYKYFKLRPTVTGQKFEYVDVKYEERDVIPGVHQYAPVDRYNSNQRSLAIMGNICYPIDIPNVETVLGAELAKLIRCPLEMTFEIGELDFQASREGLSYIPETITAIKSKLEMLVTALSGHLEKRAGAIKNFWDKVKYLEDAANNPLFAAAIPSYCANAKLPLLADKTKGNRYCNSIFDNLKFSLVDLSTKYNLKINRFQVDRSSVAGTSLIGNDRHYNDQTNAYEEDIMFRLTHKYMFISNDTKVGALRRARTHFKTKSMKEAGTIVVILEPADKTKPAQFKKFLKAAFNPPHKMLASELDVIERKGGANAKPIGLFKYVRETDYSRRQRGVAWYWDEVKTEDRPSGTVYYLPLTNKTPEFTILLNKDCQTFASALASCGVPALANITIHGVRKHELVNIKNNKDWVSLEPFIKAQFDALTDEYLDKMAVNSVDTNHTNVYNQAMIKDLPVTSPFRLVVEKFAKDGVKNGDRYDFDKLAASFRPGFTVAKRISVIQTDINTVMKKYPLLQGINVNSSNKEAVIQYITLIDNLGETK